MLAVVNNGKSYNLHKILLDVNCSYDFSEKLSFSEEDFEHFINLIYRNVSFDFRNTSKSFHDMLLKLKCKLLLEEYERWIEKEVDILSLQLENEVTHNNLKDLNAFAAHFIIADENLRQRINFSDLRLKACEHNRVLYFYAVFSKYATRGYCSDIIDPSIMAKGYIYWMKYEDVLKQVCINHLFIKYKDILDRMIEIL